MISGGKRGVPTTYLTGVKATPLDPVDPELRKRLALETPHELLQTFLLGSQDVLPGDILVSGTVEYPIRSSAEWSDHGEVLRHLVVEDLRR